MTDLCYPREDDDRRVDQDRHLALPCQLTRRRDFQDHDYVIKLCCEALVLGPLDCHLKGIDDLF